jgi:TnpA family transposase
VAYRPLLSADQWASLLAGPADERNLIRHASLSGEDLDLILSKRGHRNQLGFAAQICLMRFPGRALALNETPSALLDFLGDQLGVSPAVFADYARRDETRREHLIEVQAYLSLRAAAREDRRFALLAAIDAATATDKGLPIGEAIIKSFRDRGVLLPSAERMDRIGRAGRAIARKRALQAILNGRTPAQLAALDALLAFDSAIRQTRFGWLGAWSDSPGAANLNGLLDRLDFLRGLAMDPACRETVHPDRWKQIVREGDAAPAWLAEDFGADRRRATLLAYLIDLQERLTDEAIHMFCKQIGRLFARAAAACEERHKSSRKETTAALRLFRDTLRVLMEANTNNGDAIEMLCAKVGWRRLVEAQPSVEAMVAEKAVNPLPVAAQHHAGLRRYAPRFLAAFQFRSSRRGDSVLAAIELLTQMHRENRRALPDKFPIGHLDEPEKKLILAGGKPDRPLYEVATLGALRDRLRSGDIWVEGSRAYRPLDEYLMPTGAFTEKKDTDRLNLGVPGDAPAWLDSMRRTLDFQLKQLAYRARIGKLEGVRLVGGALVVSPLESEVPDAAEALKWELNSFLPNVHITDLLAEVDGWTGFADKFTHLRTGDMVRNRSAILAAVLADATNLGPKRMAEASSNVSERQISWARLFHVRPETYRAAQAAIIDAHSAHPHATLWGAGATSSSDGQFFRASDRAAGRSDVNLHYGSEPGTKFYSHLSDQYGYFSILPISPSESEAPYVLDGLFDHESKLDIDEHYTDTGGSSDHVFGLFALLGRRFAPRLRNLKDRKFHAFEKLGAYPALKADLGPRINIDLILDNWDELLRMAASMNERIVAPSTILKKLSASRRPSELARALREVGRLERTRFMIEWYCDPKLRRRCLGGLNKGESAHKLKRAVFFHERGEVRDRSFDSQAFRASGLNLVVSAIVHWNTVYFARVVDSLKGKGRTIPSHLLKHVSPISWEHINLTGTYSWRTEPTDPTSFRPLREEKSFFGLAA